MRRLLVVILVLSGVVSTYAATRKLPESMLEVKLSFSKVVKKVAPAVVNVYSTKIVEQQRSIFGNDPFFQQFFGNGFGQNKPRVQNSLGSGVIVSASGILVTNHHVVKDADKIKVVMSDLREFDAKLVLEDKRTDLAVLQIVAEGETFAFINFADSDGVEVGDLTLAIGNPFGVGQTVTSGIVSAIARTNVGISDFQFFIQTDAAINPGNSGGALVDSLGQLIGVNTAIFSRSGGSNGIGFAIPANMVNLVVNSAKLGDRVQRPWLAADVESLSSEIALSLGLDSPNGVLVLKTIKNGPFSDAGITRGDVIVALDGKRVNTKEQFSYLLASKMVGDRVSFSVLRQDLVMDIGVEMIAAAEDPPRRMTLLQGNIPFSGAVIMNISPAVIEEMSLPLDSVGVIISEIQVGSAAERFGFKVGDVIKSISNVPMHYVGDVLTETSYKKRFWRFIINRNGQMINSIING